MKTAFFFLLAVSPAFCGEWMKIQSPNFEVYTTASERRGREVSNYFEQVRDVYKRIWPAAFRDNLPVRIVVFSSEKEYKPYRFNSFAAAYYMPDRDRDYIIMTSSSPETFPTAVHEYTHLMTEHAKLNLPPWLNEGFADVNSTLRQVGDKIQLGEPIPGRVQELGMQKWMPLQTILNVDHSSPEYNEKSRAGMFYAESWLLTHMMYLSNAYRPRFADFVSKMLTTRNPETALREVYGKSVADVEKDLHAYIHSSSINVINVEAKMDKPSERPTSEPAPEVDVRLTLAYLLTRGQNPAAADPVYVQLEKDFPKSAEVHEAIANNELRKDHRDLARKEFAQAMELGASNPRMYLSYAFVLQDDNGPEYVNVLTKAADLNPDRVDLRLALGTLHYTNKNYQQAITELRKVHKVDADQAPRLFLALAYSYLQMNEKVLAKQSAEQVLKYAKLDSDRGSAERVIQYVDQKAEMTEAAVQRQPAAAVSSAAEMPDDAPPPEDRALRQRNDDFVRGQVANARRNLPALKGTLENVECSGESAKLTVKTATSMVKLLVKDPGSVIVENRGSQTVDFTCGPQNHTPIFVNFNPHPDSATGTMGIVSRMEFNAN